MGLFDKKYCDICGEKIGLLGNRKLEDGNLCKECAKKLSPWFEERRHSTVEDIKNQLQYREENKAKVAQFNITREFGERWRVLIDENHRWFMITTASNLEAANPDVVDISQLTSCRLVIDENRREIKKEDANGKEVSYNPPRYEYEYDFDMKISVKSPYFDDMDFRLNNSSVELTSEAPRGFGISRSFDPSYSVEYRRYKQMGDDICDALNKLRLATDLNKIVDEAAPAAATVAAPAAEGPWTCPGCGAQNTGKFCEFCGTKRS